MARQATAAVRQQEPSRNVQAATILERSVCLTVRMRILGNHRKVKTERVVEAVHGDLETSELKDGRQLHTTKKLVDSKELSACFRAQAVAKDKLRLIAIPSHRVFGEGTFLIPNRAVVQAEAALKAQLAELRTEALALRDRWPDAVARQASLLGPKLFDASIYPTASEAAEAWDIEWNWVSFKAPEQLETVDSAVFEAAQARNEARFAAAYDEVRLVLRETLRQVTAEIARKLAPTSDGKPRVFKNTVLDDLTAFLSTFELRNIADDSELARVVGHLRQLTKGVDPQQLRDIDELREQVRKRMQAATSALDGMIGTGRRAIAFGDIDVD